MRRSSSCDNRSPYSHATTSIEEAIEALKKYCQPDIERLCPEVEFGEGQIKECLHRHRKEISFGCAETLKKLREE